MSDSKIKFPRLMDYQVEKNDKKPAFIDILINDTITITIDRTSAKKLINQIIDKIS